MKYRTLGKTGLKISEVSIGTWQVGGKWGSGFDHHLANKILSTAIDQGVNFIDTADVYEAGESERAVGKFVKQCTERVYIATKCGRQINPHVNEGYTPKAIRKYVEESLNRMGVGCIDLIQLHCPPTAVFYRPEIFDEFMKLKEEGKIQNLGVSVEKIEEAIQAISYDNVTTVQIIYNIFRQRPNDKFFKLAKNKNIGIIARVPLASGLLTGKFDKNTSFGPGDHRNFNREGEAFDKGETFSGVPYEIGLKAVEALKAVIPRNNSLVDIALRWILMKKEVSCVIPGASSLSQAKSNASISGLPDLDNDIMENIEQIYVKYIKNHVHHLW